MRHELTYIDHKLLGRMRVKVPKVLQKHVLDLHVAHEDQPGIVVMKRPLSSKV